MYAPAALFSILLLFVTLPASYAQTVRQFHRNENQENRVDKTDIKNVYIRDAVARAIDINSSLSPGQRWVQIASASDLEKQLMTMLFQLSVTKELAADRNPELQYLQKRDHQEQLHIIPLGNLEESLVQERLKDLLTRLDRVILENHGVTKSAGQLVRDQISNVLLARTKSDALSYTHRPNFADPGGRSRYGRCVYVSRTCYVAIPDPSKKPDWLYVGLALVYEASLLAEMDKAVRFPDQLSHYMELPGTLQAVANTWAVANSFLQSVEITPLFLRELFILQSQYLDLIQNWRILEEFNEYHSMDAGQRAYQEKLNLEYGNKLIELYGKGLGADISDPLRRIVHACSQMGIPLDGIHSILESEIRKHVSDQEWMNNRHVHEEWFKEVGLEGYFNSGRLRPLVAEFLSSYLQNGLLGMSASKKGEILQKLANRILNSEESFSTQFESVLVVFEESGIRRSNAITYIEEMLRIKNERGFRIVWNRNREKREQDDIEAFLQMRMSAQERALTTDESKQGAKTRAWIARRQSFSEGITSTLRSDDFRRKIEKAVKPFIDSQSRSRERQVDRQIQVHSSLRSILKPVDVEETLKKTHVTSLNGQMIPLDQYFHDQALALRVLPASFMRSSKVYSSTLRIPRFGKSLFHGREIYVFADSEHVLSSILPQIIFQAALFEAMDHVLLMSRRDGKNLKNLEITEVVAYLSLERTMRTLRVPEIHARDRVMVHVLAKAFLNEVLYDQTDDGPDLLDLLKGKMSNSLDMYSVTNLSVEEIALISDHENGMEVLRKLYERGQSPTYSVSFDKPSFSSLGRRRHKLAWEILFHDLELRSPGLLYAESHEVYMDQFDSFISNPDWSELGFFFSHEGEWQEVVLERVSQVLGTSIVLPLYERNDGKLIQEFEIQERLRELRSKGRSHRKNLFEDRSDMEILRPARSNPWIMGSMDNELIQSWCDSKNQSLESMLESSDPIDRCMLGAMESAWRNDTLKSVIEREKEITAFYEVIFGLLAEAYERYPLLVSTQDFDPVKLLKEKLSLDDL